MRITGSHSHLFIKPRFESCKCIANIIVEDSGYNVFDNCRSPEGCPNKNGAVELCGHEQNEWLVAHFAGTSNFNHVEFQSGQYHQKKWVEEPGCKANKVVQLFDAAQSGVIQEGPRNWWSVKER